MAFSKKIELEEGIIGMWEITEEATSLMQRSQFSYREKKEFAHISSERRKREYLTVRLLLKELLGKNPEIFYDGLGRPQLSNSDYNLSISHSADLAVIFLSQKKIGIDVENTERNIEKVAARFLNVHEREFVKTTADQQKTMVVLWCAKEAIFKCSEKQGIDFGKEIYILPFSITDNAGFKGIKTQSGKSTVYRLQQFDYKNNTIVFCVEEEQNCE
jgi:phosphopantetheinyl transferase (holo-ACP synthase)